MSRKSALQESTWAITPQIMLRSSAGRIPGVHAVSKLAQTVVHDHGRRVHTRLVGSARAYDDDSVRPPVVDGVAHEEDDEDGFDASSDRVHKAILRQRHSEILAGVLHCERRYKGVRRLEKDVPEHRYS